MMKPLEVNAERLVETMKEQASIGTTEGGGLYRLALTDADREVREWLRMQMLAAGLTVRIDSVGNMFGERPGTELDEPVLIGSHLDSQPNGGIFDGALGVVAALEVVRVLNEHHVKTQRSVEIVNWTNEEGSRFQPAMMGSGVWAGLYALEEVYTRSDKDGRTVLAELERIGYRGELPARPRHQYHAYLELHIEQGPRLESQGADIGIVTGIVGISWGEVVFIGEPNHAGTVPMHRRRDALVAAAELIRGIRFMPSMLSPEMVSTVGFLSVDPNSINIIPGKVKLTWDCRDPERERLEGGREWVSREAAHIARQYGVRAEVRELMFVPPIQFSKTCIKSLQAASDLFGYKSIPLVSYAGHDAQNIAKIFDTAMVFVPSRGGKSHSPEEFTSWEDCIKGANVLLNSVLALAGIA